jgi:hypothetical protein
MRAKTACASACVALALLGTIVAGCGRGYREIVVVDGGKAEFVTLGRVPKGAKQELWVPDRVLVFRTSSAVPGAPGNTTGTAGRVYRVNDQLEMEEIGEFDPSMPNDTLAYRFGG